MERRFWKSGPNRISSDEGWVQLHRVGLDLAFRDEKYHISSEMLVPPMSIGIYFSSSPAGRGPNSTEVREYLVAALDFAGYTADFV